MIELFTGIMERWASTDGAALRAILTSGLHNTRAPQEILPPYGVFSLTSGRPEDTFTELGEDCLVQFSLFAPGPSPLLACQAYAALDALFDRQTLTLTGGYVSTWLRRESNILHPYDEEDKSWHYSADYRFRIEKER